MKKTIIVSGINMTHSGIKTILNQCLETLSILNKYQKYTIIALVPNNLQYKNIEYIEIPLSKKSWIFRIYYEYIYFYFLSKKIKPNTWLSLHDVSPNIICKNKITYFHNLDPFAKAKLIDWRFDKKYSLFTLFYIYLYKINSNKLKHIIVQQNFIKQLFKNKGFKNIIVARPVHVLQNNFDTITLNNKKLNFIFPSEAKVFKNHILIAEALKLLPENIQNQIEIYFTFDSNTNKFSNYFCEKYKNLASIKYLGWLSKNELYGYYQAVDALLFPSKLETWGLPISEIQQFEKPIIISNLEYAQESIGSYDKVIFFNPKDPKNIADILLKMVNKEITYQKVNCEEKPDFKDWESLLTYILSL